jgi:hypothetical protein
MAMPTVKGDPPAEDPPAERSIPAATLGSLIDRSGRRWTLLGTMLLVLAALAVWTVRSDPVAIVAVLFAISTIFGKVPKIMQARVLYYGVERGDIDSRRRNLLSAGRTSAETQEHVVERRSNDSGPAPRKLQ